MSLPVGHYRWSQVVIDDGTGPFVASKWYPYSQHPVAITENKPALLKIGGPLRQILHAEPRGSVVRLQHELVGVAGETYARMDRRFPPEFVVRQGDRQIAKGTFEYG